MEEVRRGKERKREDDERYNRDDVQINEKEKRKD